LIANSVCKEKIRHMHDLMGNHIRQGGRGQTALHGGPDLSCISPPTNWVSGYGKNSLGVPIMQISSLWFDRTEGSKSALLIHVFIGLL
jgi:hypothetical protein